VADEKGWWEGETSPTEEAVPTPTQDSELGVRGRLGTVIFFLALTLNTVWWYAFQRFTSTQSVLDYVFSGSGSTGRDPFAAFFVFLIIAFWPALTVFYLARRYSILPTPVEPDEEE
jgi:hypothetical protein